MEFKGRLIYLMNRRGVANAAELSRMTGLTQVAIRNYMRGIKVPNAQALIKLSRALSTTADYLLTGSPLRPDRIPLLSKITHIIDVFEALTSKRPYKEPKTAFDALRIIYASPSSSITSSWTMPFPSYTAIMGSLITVSPV